MDELELVPSTSTTPNSKSPWIQSEPATKKKDFSSSFLESKAAEIQFKKECFQSEMDLKQSEMDLKAQELVLKREELSMRKKESQTPLINTLITPGKTAAEIKEFLAPLMGEGKVPNSIEIDELYTAVVNFNQKNCETKTVDINDLLKDSRIMFRSMDESSSPPGGKKLSDFFSSLQISIKNYREKILFVNSPKLFINFEIFFKIHKIENQANFFEEKRFDLKIHANENKHNKEIVGEISRLH